jgi:PAS domain S-box-containing protein
VRRRQKIKESNEMPKKILVVDNHPVVLKFMTELLEKEGHQVRTADTGLEALDILRNFIPDVIFIDLIMPNIDGKKFCQIIRKMPKLNDVFLVVLSAIAAEQNVNFTEFGANACIAKAPFNRMAKYIHNVMDRWVATPSASLTDQVMGLSDVFPRHITEELLFVKRHFEAILSTMSEGILEVTSEGRIVYANPAAIALIGILEETLLASNFTDLFKETDSQLIKNQLVAIHNQSKTIIRDFPITINGKQILLDILPVMDERHRTIVIILNDVSDRKRMEAQLLQAQKMEAIGTLAGGIAHDFNNLLMVIQGNVSLMLLQLEAIHPHYEMLKNIEKQVQNGSKLTGQLLGYARKGRYEVKPLLLNYLVREISEAFGRTRKNITIHHELSQGLFPCEADQGQIEQVLMNLFVNAADAMPEGGDLSLKTVNITHEEIKGKLYDPKPGDYILLTVADTGIGMDHKTLDHIFEPFFTTKELGRGTGLGLASVYGIIKGHGGYIDVESEKGYGTTFKIYLPASVKKVQEGVKTAGLIMKGTGTVLLVDDEEEVLNVGDGFLKAMGYQVITAHDGKEATEVYRKHQESIDLVVLDIVMPVMGGSEVFDRLKKINPDIKVLLSSGYSIDGEATKILERGASGFIQKPFNIKQLSQSIHEILKK